MTSDADLNNLLEKLVNGEVEEQVRASYALENIGEPAVLPLIELLKTPDIHWDLIARTLGSIGDKRAVEPLIESLEKLNSFNERHSSRKSIVFALGKLKDARAVDVLLSALNQRFYETDRYDGTLREEFDEATTEAIEWALTKIGDPRALEPIFQRIFEDRYQYSDLLKAWGEPAFKLVMNELTRENSNRIGDAAALLGDFDDPRAVETLIELLLNNKDDTVRVSSAYALSKLKNPRSFDAFLKALNDSHATTREWAVIGLMRLKDSLAIEHLNKALADENAQVRRCAQDAIKYIESQ